MCQLIHARLSHDEKKQVKQLSGILVPIYASVFVVLFAIATISHLSRSNDAVAARKIETTVR